MCLRSPRLRSTNGWGGGSAVVEKPCCRATVWTRCTSLADFEPCYDVLILNLILGWQNKVQKKKGWTLSLLPQGCYVDSLQPAEAAQCQHVSTSYRPVNAFKVRKGRRASKPSSSCCPAESLTYSNTTVISIILTRQTSFTCLILNNDPATVQMASLQSHHTGHLFWVVDGSGCQPIAVEDGLTGSSLSNANVVQVELHWKRMISLILAVVWPEAAAIK